MASLSVRGARLSCGPEPWQEYVFDDAITYLRTDFVHAVVHTADGAQHRVTLPEPNLPWQITPLEASLHTASDPT